MFNHKVSLSFNVLRQQFLYCFTHCNMSPDILVTISVWNQIKPQYIVIHVVTEGENVSMFSATE